MMKQLVCEMCGSADLVKQDGVFVCQSCGCKYSVEEARKMMVEGTVDVSGSTVRIDDSGKIENYLKLAENAYSSGNGQSTFEYANKALEISPQNAEAWILKMKSIEYIGTFGNLRLKEVIDAGKNAVAFADKEHKDRITHKVYYYQAARALSVLKLVTLKIADTDDIERIFRQFSMVNFLSAAQNTMNADSKVVALYDLTADEALMMVQDIPNEVLAEFPDITSIVQECAWQYQSETNALSHRFEIYATELTDFARKTRSDKKWILENKVIGAQEVARKKKAAQQKERNDRYWAEHTEEKIALTAERETLKVRITTKEAELSNHPGNEKIKCLQEKIRSLSEEKQTISLFKVKEKKLLQERIYTETLALENLKARVAEEKAEIKKQIEPLYKRLTEIDAEFSKAR